MGATDNSTDNETRQFRISTYRVMHEISAPQREPQQEFSLSSSYVSKYPV
jgi:hypothetical protein